jgi:hypothetical protein
MPEWVRVRDKDTGHEYDVAPSAVRDDAHEVLEDYPPNSGTTARPRPPKHRVDKDGKPATGARNSRNADPSANKSKES